MEQSNWYLILNPQSGGGKAAKLEAKLKRTLNDAGICFHFYKTNCSGDAQSATQSAIENGFYKIIVAGGDGTLNEVVNGVLHQSFKPSEEILIAQIPLGTGNDWRRTWKIPGSMKASVSMLQNPISCLQDAAKITFQRDGHEQSNWFLNIAGCGFDAEVTFAANKKKSEGKSGILTYLYQLILTLKKFKEPNVDFEIDTIKYTENIFAILAGVCKYAGNAMLLVPDANPSDGLFHLSIAKKISRMKVVFNLHRLFDGSFVKLNEVEVRTCKQLKIITPGLSIQADGESIGYSPAVFEIFEKKLHVVIHPNYVFKKSN